MCVAQAIEKGAAAAAENAVVIVSVRSDVPAAIRINPDDLVDSVNSGKNSASFNLSELGAPVAAAHTFGKFDYPASVVIPANSALRNMALYVTLAYASSAEADAAVVDLSADERFGYVGRDTEGGFSPTTHPNDQFYTRPLGATVEETGYQWGMYALNMAGAWHYTPGWGRVGIVDAGPQVAHPDLQGRLSYFGSYDIGLPVSGNYGMRTIGLWSYRNVGIHGTHVAGIALAAANNPTTPASGVSLGVSGACQGCTWQHGSFSRDLERAFAGRWLTQWGAQVVNLSGYIPNSDNDPQSVPDNSDCAARGYSPNNGAHSFCQSLLLMHQRDSVFVASSGNNKSFVHFPARDPYALAIGGIDVRGRLWDESLYGQEAGDWPSGCPNNPSYNVGPTTTFECGSNYGLEQGFVAPARKIVSSVPAQGNYSPNICGDGLFSTAADGYGYCTGTSMSAPHVSGILGLARSIYPTLPTDQLVSAMRATASGGGVHNPQMGFGVPNAGLLVEKLLGKSNGTQLRNRLTPMFVLRNLVDKDRLYTTNPTLAAAAVYGEYMVTPVCHEVAGAPSCDFSSPESFARPYSMEGITANEAVPVPSVSLGPTDGYAFPSLSRFPAIPSASFYVFTTPQSPYVGVTLAPLKKLLFASECDWRDHVYATNAATVNYFTNTEFCGQAPLGDTYKLDGIEGYVMASCPSTVNALGA